MGNMKFFENMVETKLLNMHTAYLAKVLLVSGGTAKIQPLGMSKAYGENSQVQSPLSNVPIAQAARYKLASKKLTYEDGTSPIPQNINVLVPTPLTAGDIVICICCDRDITEAKKGQNSALPVGHHSMSSSVIIGVL